MSEITITEIHRYPVKSMLGETPSEVMVSERGIHGDRAWATRDEIRGGIRGAKKLPQLMLFSARSIAIHRKLPPLMVRPVLQTQTR